MFKFFRVRIYFLVLLFLFCGFSGQNVFARECPVKKGSPGFCKMNIISGNKQSVSSGNYFALPIKVKLTANNGAGLSAVPVEFLVVNPYADTMRVRPYHRQVLTDSAGFAETPIYYSGYSGEVEVIANCKGIYKCSPQVFVLTIRKPQWVFLLVVGLFGGLALFLLGMSMMSEGLQKAAGNRMRNILGRMTRNRFLSVILGTLMTVATQSSSATYAMIVSFVNSQLIRFQQSIGIILGAAIGSSITIQIIAFRLSDYALLFVIAGLAIQWTSGKHPVKEIGRAILGFGILFYGMFIMSEAIIPLHSYNPFLEAILKLQNPALGIIAGAVLTAIVQSSNAFVGILIILSTQGLLSLDAAIPLVIGANLGTSFTAILASVKGNREARQVAFGLTVYKLIGAAIILLFLSYFTWLVLHIGKSFIPDSIMAGEYIASPRQIANAHTLYNLIVCLLFLPFTNTLAKLISWIFPVRADESDMPFKLRYLDQNLLTSPSLALNVARLELLRMMKKVYHMSEKIILPFIDKEAGVLHEINSGEKEINFLRDKLDEYLIQISQNSVNAESAEEAYNMMNAVREFEEIADIISRPLKTKAESWCRSDYKFSDQGLSELTRYHNHTLSIISQAINVYEQYDLKEAKKLKSSYDNYREEYFELERQHYDRLRDNIDSTIQSSKTHLEIITLLRVISSHATNTSRILIYKTNHRKKKLLDEQR
jgi:phosphate:Na+ symporter